MINEANEPSSACRLWRISQVETSTPPKTTFDYRRPWPRRQEPWQPNCARLDPGFETW